MNKSHNIIPFISSILSFLVVFSLAFPSKYNALSIYLFCSFVLFFMVKRKSFKWKNSFVILSVVYFFLHVVYLFFDNNSLVTLFEVEKKLSFLVLPFFWYNLPVFEPQKVAKRALDWFSVAMSFFGLFLLSNAFLSSNYLEVTTPFFYHDFVSIFDGNAIYFSLLFTVSLLILIENNRNDSSLFLFISIAFQSIILILLSSKLFLFILGSLLIYLVVTSKRKIILLSFVIILLGSLFWVIQTSIVNRFKDIEKSSFFELKKEINPATKFDGFTLRKELWNIGLEIAEKDSKLLFFGVGPGDAQDEINSKLKSNNFYLGNGMSKKTGFLNYNCHNQYIQSILETGLFGLSLILFLFLFLLYAGFITQNKLLILFNFILLAAFFTESYLSRQIGIISFLGFNFMFLELKPIDYSQHYNYSVKRLFDILFSGLIIIFILSWFLPIMGLLIYIDTKSFPLFVQNRAGRNGRIFRCFKMRTMLENEDADLLPAMEGDIRITRFGNFLRKYAVDELPQFFNVFLGQMSVVGPRPLMVNEEEAWNIKVLGFSERLSLKPGVTGLAQANGYKGIINHNSDLMVRFRLDKLYSKRQSIWLDIKIILRTILYIFT